MMKTKMKTDFDWQERMSTIKDLVSIKPTEADCSGEDSQPSKRIIESAFSGLNPSETRFCGARMSKRAESSPEIDDFFG